MSSQEKSRYELETARFDARIAVHEAEIELIRAEKRLHELRESIATLQFVIGSHAARSAQAGLGRAINLVSLLQDKVTAAKDVVARYDALIQGTKTVAEILAEGLFPIHEIAPRERRDDYLTNQLNKPVYDDLRGWCTTEVALAHSTNPGFLHLSEGADTDRISGLLRRPPHG